MLVALVGAIVLGVLSAFYDFLWAYFDVRHSVINGLVHGMTLLSVLGLVLGWPSGRRVAGLVGGAAAGLAAAASFYAFYPLLGYLWAIVAAWIVMWLLFAGLEAWLGGRSLTDGQAVLRGGLAALLSAGAFYLVSGMWTDHSVPPNYFRSALYWTFAFFPGFAALLWRERTLG